MSKYLNNIDLQNSTTSSMTIGIEGNSYTLPNTRGNNGQILKIDGVGNVSWVDDNGGGGGDNTYSITTVNSSPYNISSLDDHLNIDTSTLNISLILPQISTLGTTNNYKSFIISDISGNTNNNNINISTSGGDTILNENSLLINSNFSSITIKSDGINKWFIT